MGHLCCLTQVRLCVCSQLPSGAWAVQVKAKAGRQPVYIENLCTMHKRGMWVHAVCCMRAAGMHTWLCQWCRHHRALIHQYTKGMYADISAHNPASQQLSAYSLGSMHLTFHSPPELAFAMMCQALR